MGRYGSQNWDMLQPIAEGVKMGFRARVAREGAANTSTGATQKGLASMQQGQSIYVKSERLNAGAFVFYGYNLVSSCHRIETESFF